MRKVILLEHDSLDGPLAGPQGEMDWINTDDEVWHYLHPLLDGADTVILGPSHVQDDGGVLADRPG